MQMMASKYFEQGTIEVCAGDASQVIPLLQVVQEKTGYVPEDAIGEIAEVTGAAPSDIFSVITFYKQFRLQPPGKFVIKLCDGTACHVMGSVTLLNVIVDELKLETGDTTKDGLFTHQSGGLPGLLQPGAGDHDQRGDVRGPHAAEGAQDPQGLPAPRQGEVRR